MSTRPRRLLLGLTLVAGAVGCADSDHRSPLSVPLPGEIGDGFSGTSRVIPPLVRAEAPPPPIGASTLTIDGRRRALVSDSDRDRVLLVDLETRALVTTWSFPGAEPGRLAFAPDGDHAWVVLRQTGEIARLDLGGGVDHRWSPCPSPRGVAVAPDGAVHVACLGGLLVSADADGRETARRRLAPDLRDVIVADDGALWVSRLRSAEIYRIDARGEPRLLALDGESAATGFEFEGFRPSVAWRLRAAPGGNALVVHQLAGKGEVEVDTPSGYGGFGSCSPGIVTTGVSLLDADGQLLDARIEPRAVLAVDGVQHRDGIALAAPGNRGLRTTAPIISGASCTDPPADDGHQVVAVDLDARGDLWRFSREPAQLVGPDGAVIALGGPSVFDTGHDLFHVDAGAGIACASCHPEGGEDGQIWTFSDTGPRRTQPLHGGLKGSEPFHWAGDLGDFGALAGEVFARRMGGPMVPRAYIGAWIDWIETVPMPIADLGADPIAAERGRILFEDPTVGCATCHTGDRLADRGTWDVGTGGALQTPTLRNIALRGPFMHDGCAPGLVDRFGACGGGDDHGRVSGLDRAAITDLVAYLQTL